MSIIRSALPSLYSILVHLDDGLCDVSGMCPAQVSTFKKISPASDVQCEFCEKVIQHWIDTWTSNTTEEEFKEILEALCHKMKPNRVDHCLHIVDDYYLPWFNFILHQLNPKVACKMMGLCGNQDLLEPNNTPITLLFKPTTNELPAAVPNEQPNRK